MPRPRSGAGTELDWRPMAISREQVLHVARLARLEIPEDEIESVREQLGAILEAVSKVSELDLADVAPTSHPLDIVNVWGEDEPRPSLRRDEALANAPDPADGAFRRARRLMLDTLRTTAEEAARLLERGEVSPEELTAAYAEAIASRDEELHAYLHVENEVGAGVPIALKDCITTKGVPTTAGSRILDGYVPVFDSTVAARCREAGLPLSARRTWTSSRWARRPRTRPTGPRETPGTRRACRAAPPAARRRRSPAGSRPGRSARTRAARSSSRLRCAGSSASGRPTAPSRGTASSPSPRASTRSARSRRRCATTPASTRSIAGPRPAATRRPWSCRSRSRLPTRRGSPRAPDRRPDAS